MSYDNQTSSATRSCPRFDTNAAANYLAGALPAHEAAAFAEHVAGCPDCARQLDELRPFISADEPYQRESPRAPRRRAIAVAARAAMAALALVVVGLAAFFLGLTINSQTRPPRNAPASTSPAQNTPRRSGGPQAPAPVAPGALAPPLLDEDGDGIDDGVMPTPPAGSAPGSMTSPGTIPPYSNNYVVPQMPPGAYAPPAASPATPARPPATQSTPAKPPAAAQPPEAQPAPSSQQPLTRRRMATQPAARQPETAAAQPAPREPLEPLAAVPDAKRELRRMAGKTFRREPDGSWVDMAYQADAGLPVVEVLAGSGEYQRLLGQNAALARYFRLSDQIAVVVDGTLYRVHPRAR